MVVHNTTMIITFVLRHGEGLDVQCHRSRFERWEVSTELDRYGVIMSHGYSICSNNQIVYCHICMHTNVYV
jgi:hypothetical protein